MTGKTKQNPASKPVTEAATPKKDAKKDGKKAFHIASSLEGDLHEIENLVCAVQLIAGSDTIDDVTSGALYGIVNGLNQHLESAQEKQGQIFHATWGYACGPDREE